MLEIQPGQFINLAKVRSIVFVDAEDAREAVVDYDNYDEMVYFGTITEEWEAHVRQYLTGKTRNEAGF